MKLAKLVIGSASARLRAESLEAHLAGDTAKAIDLLTEAKVRERRFEAALRRQRN